MGGYSAIHTPFLINLVEEHVKSTVNGMLNTPFDQLLDHPFNTKCKNNSKIAIHSVVKDLFIYLR